MPTSQPEDLADLSEENTLEVSEPSGAEGDAAVVGRQELTLAVLRDRQDMYLADHYTTVHMTAVSLALGVGGLAAVVLLDPSSNFHGYRLSFIALWFASLFATAVAYAGTMIGSIFLPARLPSVVDLLLPLLLGMTEFVLFAVFAARAIGVTLSVRVAFMSWWFALGVFGCVAAASVWRARHLIANGPRSPSLDATITLFREVLKGDAISAAGVGTAGATMGIVHAIWGQLATTFTAFAAILIAVGLATGLVKHQMTVRKLRAALDVV